MTRFAFTTSNRFALAAASASFAFALSITVSHPAMATCVSSGAGDTSSLFTCTDTSTFSTDTTGDFGGSTANTDPDTGNAANGATGNKVIRVKATSAPGEEGTAILTNAANITATLGVVTNPITGVVVNPVSNTNKNFAIYGIKASDSDNISEFALFNTGSISAIHNGLGQAASVFVQNDADEVTMVNDGLISVQRGKLDSVSVSGAGAITATAHAGGTSGTLAVAAGVYNNEEEIRDHNVTNNGTIKATGQYTAAIFTRSNSFELVNNGTISGYEVAPDPLTNTPGTTGSAAAIVTWDGRLLKHMPDGEVANCTSPNVCTGREAGFGKSFIENNGTINGNVIVTGLNGLSVMGRIGFGADPITINGANGAIPNSNTPGGIVDRRDSEIENNGTLIGNLYYGNGAHVLKNNAGATIDGNVIVDMRRVTNYLDANNFGDVAGRQINGNPYSVYVAGRSAAFGEDEGEGEEEDDEGGAPEIFTSDAGLTYAAALANAVAKLVEDNPDRHFTFENAGVFERDLSILTVNHQYTDALLLSTAGSNVTITPQTVDLKPHITGSGANSSKDAPSDQSGYIKGRLAIGDGAMAGWNVTGLAVDGSSSTISADGAGGSTKTTVTPIIDHAVHSGEWFLVANELYGDKLPGIDGNTVLVTWAIDKNLNKSLVVGSTVADASIVDGLSNPGITTLNALMATDGSDPDVDALAAAVQSLTEDDDVRKAGEQLKPETNYATQQAAILLNQATGQHIDARLSSVGATGSAGSFAQPSGLGMKQSDPNRSSLGGPTASVDAGPSAGGDALWGRAFGVGFNQDEVEHVDGYDARLYGILAGYDNWMAPGVRVGVALGYANTEIDGEGDTRQNNTGIDSYLVELYGSYKGSGWYATGRTGFTWHDYETTRILSVPLDDVAKGDHDGQQYNAALEIGAPMRVGGGSVLTPVASLTYSNLRQDGYTETSGAGMALAVDDQDNDSLVSGLGVKALVPVAADTVLEARALWLHEFADDAQDVTASFGAGGATFSAAGPGVGRDSAALGLGLLAQVGAESTFQLNYDANIREDFLAHIGSAQLTVRY